jgi:thiamine kinase-like enzyme
LIFLGVDIDVVTKEAFRLSARIHAKYWMKEHVLTIDWLRGREWWLQKDAESWHMSQNSVREAWTKKLADNSHGISDEYLFKLIDASVNKISLDDYYAWTKRAQWTLVHGDFHPANLMWADSVNSLKVLDWEMIGTN